jgi:hypothetical protein
VTINPCNHCQRAGDCQIKRDKLAAIRGLGFTTVTFSCATRREDFRPGMRVLAKLDYVRSGNVIPETCEEPGGFEEVPGEVTAVVMRWRNSKVYICVEEQGKTKARIFSVYPTRLTPLGGDLLPVCQHCSRPMDIDVPEWKCRWSYDYMTGAESVEDCEAA